MSPVIEKVCAPVVSGTILPVQRTETSSACPVAAVSRRFEVGEVEGRVESRGLEFVEVKGSRGGLGVVLALETMGFDRVVRGRGGRNRGQARDTENGGEHQGQFSSDEHKSSLRLRVAARCDTLYNVGRNGSWHDNMPFRPLSRVMTEHGPAPYITVCKLGETRPVTAASEGKCR